MSRSKIKNTILLFLYNAAFKNDHNANLNDVLAGKGWNQNIFWNVVEQLKREMSLTVVSTDGNARITSLGVIKAEAAGLIPDELVSSNYHVREAVLEALTTDYDKHGGLYSIEKQKLIGQIGLDEHTVSVNLRVLTIQGLVEMRGNIAKLTFAGLDVVEKCREYNRIKEEFTAIAEMRPQPRGLALQKFLAKLLEEQGWIQDEGLKTSNEEIDVIISHEREYYLLECKWEKVRIGAEVIRELFGKLGNRVAVNGIAISMSGFTKGAVKQAQDYIGQKVILLFGPDEINALVDGDVSFIELLNSKYRTLITKREIVYS